MRYLYIIICLLIITSTHCYSQKLNSDSLSRAKAKLVSDVLAERTVGRSYLLFSINDKHFLIVVEHKDYYRELYLEVDSLSKPSEAIEVNIDKPNNILKKAFIKESYHKGFINLNSDFYKSGYKASDGNATYFYFKDRDGGIYGESRLTTIIKPNPIDVEVYNYLLIKALKKLK